MYPAQTIQPLELLDGFNADGQSLLFLRAVIARFFQPFNDFIRNAKFGVSVTELPGFRRAVQGKNTGQNCRLFGEPLLAGGIEPLAEGLRSEEHTSELQSL